MHEVIRKFKKVNPNHNLKLYVFFRLLFFSLNQQGPSDHRYLPSFLICDSRVSMDGCQTLEILSIMMDNWECTLSLKTLDPNRLSVGKMWRLLCISI